MLRRNFIAGTTAVVLVPGAAHASGGLDVGDAVASHHVRVLLDSGEDMTAPKALDQSRFAYGSNTYRGSFTSVPLGDGRTGLVNTLPLDAYLYGVLSKEVSPSWPRAAQEAQAIVARTYALGKLRPSKAFDVVATESDQRYGGIDGETVPGRDAVDATGGTIVTYNGAPAKVAFGSCCGGRTADAGDVWGTPYPYLQSINDPNCTGTPEYAWETVVPYSALSRAFGAQLRSAGSLQAVELRDVDGSMRPRRVGFVGEQGTFEVASKDLRSALGLGVVRSTFLRAVSLERMADGSEALKIAGNGRGHGVGLCQWGARMLAGNGAGARDIVEFYFPSTTFGRG